MQLLEILEGLTPAELKKLEKQLKEDNRPQSYQLFRELKKCLYGVREFDREAIFKKVFSQSYSASRSYLLKNEVRLLKKSIQQFLIHAHIEKRLKVDTEFADLCLIQELAARNIKALFETEIEQLLESVSSSNNAKLKLELMRLKMDHYRHHSYTPIEEYMTFLKSYRTELIRELWINTRTVEHELARNMRVSRFKSRGVSYIADSFEVDMIDTIDHELYETDLSKFLKLRTESIGLSGEAKVKKDLELYEFVNNKEIPTVDAYQINLLLIDINDYCFALGRKQEAINYFNEYLKNIERYSLNVGDFELRYIPAMLMRMECYQLAIDHYVKYEKQILSSKFRLDICHNISYAFIFLKQSKEAVGFINETLVDESGRFPANSIERMKRTLYTILFLMDDDLEGADREWQNYKRSSAIKSITSPIGKHIIQYLDTYIKILKSDRTSLKQSMNALGGEVTVYTKQLKIQCLPLEWLLLHLKEKLSVDSFEIE